MTADRTPAAALSLNGRPPVAKPAAWLVAGGIVAAITMSASCLTILIR